MNQQGQVSGYGFNISNHGTSTNLMTLASKLGVNQMVMGTSGSESLVFIGFHTETEDLGVIGV